MANHVSFIIHLKKPVNMMCIVTNSPGKSFKVHESRATKGVINGLILTLFIMFLVLIYFTKQFYFPYASIMRHSLEFKSSRI